MELKATVTQVSESARPQNHSVAGQEGKTGSEAHQADRPLPSDGQTGQTDVVSPFKCIWSCMLFPRLLAFDSKVPLPFPYFSVRRPSLP